jgi:hypothetical protein
MERKKKQLVAVFSDMASRRVGLEKLKVIVCNKHYSYFKLNSLSLGKGWG